MYIYIYIYTYTHICICIYTCIYACAYWYIKTCVRLIDSNKWRIVIPTPNISKKKGPLRMTEAFVGLIDSKMGRMVNMSSGVARSLSLSIPLALALSLSLSCYLSLSLFLPVSLVSNPTRDGWILVYQISEYELRCCQVNILQKNCTTQFAM